MEKSVFKKPLRRMAYRAGEMLVLAAESTRLAFDGLRNNYRKEVLRTPIQNVEALIKDKTNSTKILKEKSDAWACFGRGDYENSNLSVETGDSYYRLKFTTPLAEGYLEETFVHSPGTSESAYLAREYSVKMDSVVTRGYNSWASSNDLSVNYVRERLDGISNFLGGAIESAHFVVPNKM